MTTSNPHEFRITSGNTGWQRVKDMKGLAMRRWISALSGIATLILFLAVLTAGAQTATESKPPAAEPAPAATPDGDYVGSEVCVACHAEQQKSFVHTIMGSAMAHPKGPLEALGCEACHGPGKAHVAAGGGKDTIPIRFTKDSTNTAEEKNAACLSCHNKGNQMFWKGGPHESRGMACVDCHQVHYGSPAERYAALDFSKRAMARRSPKP